MNGWWQAGGRLGGMMVDEVLQEMQFAFALGRNLLLAMLDRCVTAA